MMLSFGVFMLIVQQSSSVVDSSSNCDLVRLLSSASQKYHVNIVADIYPDDINMLKMNFDFKSDLKNDLFKIAEMSGRSMIVWKDFYILRRNNGSLVRMEQLNGRYPFVWKSEGNVSIHPIKKNDLLQPGLPEYSISTNPVSLLALGREFTKNGHPVRISPDLAQNRIVVFSSKTRVVDLMDAAGALFNATPEITLKMSAQQLALESATGQNLPKDLVARRVLSEEMLEDILSNLSPEQQEKNKNGEFLELGLNEIPQYLVGKMRDYFRISFDLTNAQIGNLGEADWSKIDQFKVRLKPKNAAGSKIISVTAVRSDGALISF